MIINGREAFNGSDEQQAKNSIHSALKQAAVVAITLAKVSGPSNTVTFEYGISQTEKNLVLQVALVERGLSTQIRRGENRGRRAKHDNVVRDFETIRLAKGTKGKVLFHIPDDFKKENASVIAYVQDLSTMVILGATSEDL